MSAVHLHAQVNGTAAGATGNLDTTGMTLIVVCTSAFHATDVDATTTITDNKGNTYTRLGKSTPANSQWCGMYYCLNPTVGTGHNWTYNLSAASDVGIVVIASNDISSPVLDQGSSSTFSTSGGASVTTVQITTTAATELIFSAYTNDDGADTVTLSNGGSSGATWTKDDEVDGGVGVRITGGHALVSSTGTFSATWATTGSTTIGPRGIGSFKASGGAVQDTPELRGRPEGLRGQNQMQQLLAA